ncbi:hypothetical protein ASD08_37170 [Streptomyces sp. Root369]|nr:hypothetical protein ASD08_37170 [Streptomyces sp. Root369]
MTALGLLDGLVDAQPKRPSGEPTASEFGASLSSSAQCVPVQTYGDTRRDTPWAPPAEFTALLWVRVFPKHTDQEFAPTPDDAHDQLPRPVEEVRRSMYADAL